MTRTRGMFSTLLFLLLTAIPAQAATTDFRVLFDTDNDGTTGCVVAGMPGVDLVFRTQVTTTETAASVTLTSRQVCTAGTLGAETDVDTTSWPARLQQPSGTLGVESLIPFSAFGGLPGNMRIGVQGTTGAAVHTVILRTDGTPAMYPSTRGKRRSVGAPGDARVITLDGDDADWFGISPLFNGIAGGGTAGLRIIKVTVFADVFTERLYFFFDANISADSPFAVDDDYVRDAGSDLTILAPGVLANDGDPNGLPITALPVTPAEHGDVTLNPDGSFTYTPDNPAATDTDEFEYKATNGTKDSNAARVRISVNVEGNDAPEITSAGAVSVDENTTAVLTLSATDADGDSIDFNITGGADAARFSISSGNLVFNTAPNFENPADSDDDNVYFVEVTADDGNGGDDSQTIVVTVNNVNEEGEITSPNSASVPENTTDVLTVTVDDPDGDVIAFSIAGGTDAGDFTIDDNTGELSFITAPNFEVPADSNADNVYTVTVAADDGENTITQVITVTVTNVNEGPAFTFDNTVTIDENTTAVTTVTTTDPEGDTVTYSITGGADFGQFTINASTGVLAFLSAPNFEAPADSDTNNVYIVQVTANDGTTSSSQTVFVTVADLNEAPAFTFAGEGISVPENTTSVLTATANDQEGDTLTFSITGGADAADFSINASTGALSFVTAPNFEAPADADANNVYTVQLTVSDGLLTAVVTIDVVVTNVNEGPVFTSGNAPSVVENTTAVTTVTTTDEDGDTVTYSITGGADAADFSINASTGVLTFNAAPDFEAPADADTNNIYVVQVTANDGTNNSNQTLNVTVTNENEAPAFTSGAANSVPENTTAAYTATTSDPEGDTVTYSITGGADAADFSINASTGAVTFNAAPNFEAPHDADTNNTYVVEITANDGALNTPLTVTITVTDANDAPVITSANAASAPENQVGVQTATATDEDGDTVTWSITGGADAAFFSINASTGALTFNAAPNFEAPADAGANNVYQVQVTANDGTASTSQLVDVTVTNVDEAPVFTSTNSNSIAENTTAAHTVVAADPEANAVTYSITGGADMALFSINASTGALTFNSAPDFEAPADADTNNTYIVQVTAFDGALNSSQTVTITVTNANETPSFTSANTNTVPENTLTAQTVTADDPEAGTLTFSITGGADAADFSIDSNTGVLTFNTAPDFENPADADSDNQYVVQVTVSDGTNSANQTVTITVSNVDEAPEFTSSDSVSVAEGNTAVTTVTTTDQEGDTVTYSITGGADAADFSVDTNTGALTFNVAPDFEIPADADTNNIYVVEVTANDGTNNTAQTITVTVTDANEAPAITSSSTPSVPENTTAVLTATATDQEGNTVTWSITGGADAADFSINSSSGALTFNSAPNFEAPADADTNNQYIVEITANDGTSNTAQTITVTVTDVNEAPVVTSSNTASVAENTTAVLTAAASDQEGNTVTWSIVGGADAGDFSIDTNTGALTFTSAPDFENPADADTNNEYIVTIRANDGTNDTDQTVTVTVTDANEAPSITSANSANVPENTTAVIDVDATDVDAGATLSYSITGGADAALFGIVSGTGVLTFNSAPNFEAPADADTNNQYIVEVTATDNGSLTDVQTITVTVTDANEAPSITTANTASVAENTTAVIDVDATDVDAGASLSYSITGGADAGDFSIVAGTGVLTFNPAPDFELPGDADANNEYIVEVTVTDGSLTDVQTITVTVTDANEAPSITTANTASVAENTTAVIDVDATDVDAGASLTFSITGGADAGDFSIVAGTGVLTFNPAPDFELPGDADANNEYIVEVTVSDGSLTDVQTITVTVTDANEAPSITTANTASVAENTTAVIDVDATDVDAGASLSYSITGGADAGDFSIVAGTGVLTFNPAPDFELPGDADANNEYIVEVTVSDGSLTDVQTITVTVTDANEAPTFTSTATPSAAENQTSAVDVDATDPDAGASLNYTITGGADMALFGIVAGTGVLTFNSAPDFESPADADTNNAYEVEVTVTDGTNPVVQNITVTVTNVNEAPSITSANTASVPENTVVAIDVDATDVDAATTLTFSITGGADAGDFTIDGSTGVLSFNPAPDFENPADADTNNEYIVEVTVSDGALTDVQTITITVTAVNEAPSFTSPNTASVPENTTAVHTVTTTDPELDTVTYTVTGGADMAKFSIDLNTGALSFNSAPDFETPTDADTDNVYVVEVTGFDGTNNAVQSISVTVLNGNELPTFTSTATPNVPENQTAVLTVTTNDVDGDTVTYSITGGADAADFTIDTNTGALSFLVAPNFEAPHDADTNNIYLVEVTADDGPNTAVQNLTVTVTDVNEAPVYSSGAVYSQGENISAVTTVVATDPEGVAVTYTVTGGADAGDFAVHLNTGALSFVTPPNFEAPADAGANNVYNVEVTATDGVNPVMQAITVTITNVEEGPVFTSSATPSVPENMTTAVDVDATDPEGQTVTYSIVGGADMADFSVDLNTGVLTFLVAPNFELPHDADTNNQYLVNVQADDGTSQSTQNITVIVTDVNEAPSFTSANTANVPENTTAVIDVDATDPDTGASLTYSIVGGLDAGDLSIVGGTGVLTFTVAPNFEAPTDDGANNVYNVDVQVTDGTNPVTQSITVTVTDVNEAPVISSANTANVAENTTAVIDVDATDPEGLAVTYSIVGGADMGDFSIVAGTGVLTFSPAPNFEAPADADTNNVYIVQVQATDGTNPVTQTITVTVTNVNEAPVNTVPGAQSTAEDTNKIFSSGNANQISVSDPDGNVNVQVTLTSTNGTLSTNGVAGLTFVPPGASNDGVDDTTLVFTGTVSVINTALNGLTYKPTLNYYGAAAVTILTNDQGNTGSGGAQQSNGGTPNSIAITVTPVNDAPTATVKTHTTHSGIGLTISAATHTGELKEGAADVDDHDPFSELTVQIVGGTLTPVGSTLTLIDANDGSFYYEPRGGVSGAGSGSFQFQVCDNGDVGLGLAPQCSTATTVTFNMTGPDLWFVDDTDAAGCGVNCNGARTKPLVGLNTANANYTGRGTGDRVFVFSGTYASGHTFAASESLIGQGSSGVFDTVLGVSVPGNGTLDTRPTLAGTAPSIGGVTAANTTVLRGVAINSGAAKGYFGNNATPLTVLESSVNAANMAVDLTGALAGTSIAFTSTTSTAGTHGILLQRVVGTYSFGTGGPLATDGLKNHTTAGFQLTQPTGGTNLADITYSGVIQPGAGGRAVSIGTDNANNTNNASNGIEGGTITLSGNMTGGGISIAESAGGTFNATGVLTFSTGATAAINLVDNDGATMNFSNGNLAVTTTNGNGIHAIDGGTVNITGDNNTVTTTGSGRAVNVAGTSAAAKMPGTLRFKSINKSGSGTKGIVVNFTTGTFTVTGDGVDGDTLPDSATSGGTITGTTTRGAEFITVDGGVSLGGMTFTNTVSAADGGSEAICGSDLINNDNTPCNAAIHLQSIDAVGATTTLRTITVNGSTQTGINGTSVRALTMNGVSVQNCGSAGIAEHGATLRNLLGTNVITGSAFSNNAGRGLYVINTSTEATDPTLSITSSTFSNSGSLQGALFDSYTTGDYTVNVGDDTVGGMNTFSGNFSNALQQSVGLGGDMVINIKRNTFNHTVSGIILQAAGVGTQSTLNYTIWNNTVVKTNGTAANGSGAVIISGTQQHLITGDIRGNSIGNGTAGSGAHCNGACVGITVDHSDISAGGGGRHDVTIVGNDIRNVDLTGIRVLITRKSKGNIVITGNLVRDPWNGAVQSFSAMQLQAGIVAADTNCMAATIGGGVTPGAWPSTAANAMNRIEGSWDPAGFQSEIYVERKGGTLNIVGGSAPYATFIGTQNSITDATGADVTTIGTISNGASCP